MGCVCVCVAGTECAAGTEACGVSFTPSQGLCTCYMQKLSCCQSSSLAFSPFSEPVTGPAACAPPQRPRCSVLGCVSEGWEVVANRLGYSLPCSALRVSAHAPAKIRDLVTEGGVLPTLSLSSPPSAQPDLPGRVLPPTPRTGPHSLLCVLDPYPTCFPSLVPVLSQEASRLWLGLIRWRKSCRATEGC